MRAFSLFAALGLLLGGCSAPPSSAPQPPAMPTVRMPPLQTPAAAPGRVAVSSLLFPESTATCLITPDGRSWRVAYAKSEAGGVYQLEFEPSERTPDRPLEKLSFSVTGARMSRSQLMTAFSETKEKFDPQLIYSFDGDDDAFVLCYQSPTYHERSIWRVLRQDNHYVAVTYRERLGADGAASSAYWTRTITELPAAFFEVSLAPDRAQLPASATDPAIRLLGRVPHEGDKTTTTITSLSATDAQPKIRFYPNPDFRFAAHLQGSSAKVVLELDILSDGTAANVVVIEANPPAAGEATAEAFQRAKYLPAQLEGSAVSRRVRLTYDFTL